MAAAPEYFIGLMSGTSLDGVDAVLADFSVTPPQLSASYYLPYPESLRQSLLALSAAGDNELHRASMLANKLARLYHDAVSGLLAKAQVDKERVRAIGCHGQTLRHNPAQGYSLQLNNPSLLAELSSIAVVADFRNRDIAAGGQGAPLVPAFHDALWRHPGQHRVVLNIGGIANLTDLRPGSATRGFDCGPGNMLMDAWAQLHLGTPFDSEGRWAASGQVLPALLGKMLLHPFLNNVPPKSCGREEFNLSWLKAQLDVRQKPQDVQASLLEFTASAITQAIVAWCDHPAELLVCGGGAKNTALMTRLRALLSATEISTTDRYGVGSRVEVNSVEAFAFAWLARQNLLGQPGNLPQVTGAKGSRVLGAVYPA